MIRQQLSNWVEHVLDAQKLRRASHLPSQVHLSVTDRCFLPCKHCDIWKNEAVDLSTEVWLKLIKARTWCAPLELARRALNVFRAHSSSQKHGLVSFNTNTWL